MRSFDFVTAFAERLRSHCAALCAGRVRPKWLQADIAISAALFGAAACNAGIGAEQLPDGGGGASGGSGAGGGMSGAGAGGSRASGGTSISGSDGAGGTDDSGADTAGGIDGANAECGTIPEPNAWARWVMPNPVRSGLPNPASYTVSESGNQVTDNVTGLIWQRNVDARSFIWEEAKQYCSCLTIDGVTGWRLPSRIELVSIADWTTSRPSIDSNAFPNTPSASFWTSSILLGDAGLGWLVYFETGFTTYIDRGYPYRARCVR